ncbi:hypothetical protein OSG_eHP15_00030 [environmental Halophage eHP-15]|nr:hypothetical protein OSG_eHP15_00030 [environmental Halophage eHP-15]
MPTHVLECPNHGVIAHGVEPAQSDLWCQQCGSELSWREFVAEKDYGAKASGETITLTDSQQARIEAIQQQTTEGSQLPMLPVTDVIDCLLDTWGAVKEGHYTEDHTPNSELEALHHKFRRKAEHTEVFEERVGSGIEKAYSQAANELEALIDDTQAGDADE